MKKPLFLLFLTYLNLYITSAEFMVNILNSNQDNITISVTPDENMMSSKPNKIPFDYAFYPGYGYYKFHKTAQIWADARDSCSKEGGYLAVPNSTQELHLFLRIFKLYPKSSLSNDNVIHIGATSIFTNGKFTTLTGQPLIGHHVKWGSGQPSGPGSENCGCIVQKAEFHDCYCTDVLHFICKIDV